MGRSGGLSVCGLVILFVVALVSPTPLAAQEQQYQCWGCWQVGTWPYGGERCYNSAPAGSMQCAEWLENGFPPVWRCQPYGDECTGFSFTEGQPSAVVVDEGAVFVGMVQADAKVLVSPCGGRTIAYVDHEGQTLGVVTRPARGEDPWGKPNPR